MNRGNQQTRSPWNPVRLTSRRRERDGLAAASGAYWRVFSGRWITWVGAWKRVCPRRRAGTRRPGGDDLYPPSAEAVAQRALGRVERRLQPKAADHDHVAARREHAHHLVEENRHADLGHQLKRAVSEGQPCGVTDQELDAPRQLGGKLRPRLLDHRLRDVQARDPRLRKLSGEPQRSSTGSSAEIERPGRRRASSRETAAASAARCSGASGRTRSSQPPASRSKKPRTGRRISGQVQGARATSRVRAFPITRTGRGGGGLVRSGGPLTPRP
jgi:hypothetical protein